MTVFRVTDVLHVAPPLPEARTSNVLDVTTDPDHSLWVQRTWGRDGVDQAGTRRVFPIVAPNSSELDVVHKLVLQTSKHSSSVSNVPRPSGTNGFILNQLSDM